VAGAAPGRSSPTDGAQRASSNPAVNPLPFRPIKGYISRMWIGPLAAPAYPDAEENP
jgi:hypothetical protein